MANRTDLFALCALVASIAQANGGLLPVNFAATADGADYRYTYSVQLQSGASLKTGDYFTIFDFDGLVAGKNTQPDGFVFSSSMTGPTPAHVTPSDDPQLSNLTWTYTGSEAIGPGALGDFSAVSRHGTTADDSFVGQTHTQAGGKPNSNVTDVRVPLTSTRVPVPPTPSTPHVPEPATWILLVAGIPVVAAVWRFRRMA